MKYTVITRDIHNLRAIQDIISKTEKTAELFLECNIDHAVETKCIWNVDILLIEAAEKILEYLEGYIWEENTRPEIILILSCWDEKILRKVEDLSCIYLLNIPFQYVQAEKILKKAVRHRQEHISYEKLKKQAGYMQSHKYIIEQQFWTRLINGQMSLNPAYFIEEAANCGVRICLKDLFHVAILSRKLLKGRNMQVEQETRAVLLKMTNKWIQQQEEEYILVDQLRPILLARNMPKEEFVYKCEKLVEDLDKEYGLPICIYYDEDVYCENLFTKVHYVMAAEREDWVEAPGVYPAVVRLQGRDKEPPIMIPEQMESLIQNGYYFTALQTVGHFLEGQAGKGDVSSNYLRMLRLDMEQVIMSVLKNKSIPAHKVLLDKKFKDLVDNAHISVESFMAWLSAVFDCIPQSETMTSQAEEIQKYVKEHIFENISREEIANYFYRNPDYMGRQYKRETGEALGQYINREKMKKAGEILTTTTKTIGEIADMLGFNNFAHFSKLFKKFMGCTPKEYRFQYSRKNNSVSKIN